MKSPISEQREHFPRQQAGRGVMWEEAVAVVHSMGVTLMKILPVSVALGAVFALLSFFWACNPGQPWWRKPYPIAAPRRIMQQMLGAAASN